MRAAQMPSHADVVRLAFAVGGARLYAHTARGLFVPTVNVWDLRRGTTAWRRHAEWDRPVRAISPDGDWWAGVSFAPESDDRDAPVGRYEVWLLGPAGERRLKVLPPSSDEDRVNAVTFSPDGRWLAVTAWGEWPAVWDVTRPSGPVVAEMWDAFAPDLAFAPDGSALVVTSETWVPGEVGRLRLDPEGERLEVLSMIQTPGGGRVEGLAAGPGGRAAAVRANGLHLWDRDGRLTAVAAVPAAVTCLAYDHAGRLVAAGHGDGGVTVFDADTGRTLGRYAWDVGRVGAVAFAPDGLTCAAGGTDGRVVVWDVDGG